MAYFKVIFWHFPGRNKESQDKH